MFRFFCTKCKKVKRVQHSGRVIGLENQFSDNPINRTGICRRHTESKPVKAETPRKSFAVVNDIAADKNKKRTKK